MLYNSDKSQSLKLDKGILDNKRTQSGTGKDGTFNYDVYKVRGDKQASSMFEFLAQNTKVEWSQTLTGVKGDKGLNFLTTSHDKSSERGVMSLFRSQLQNGYTIRGHNHNHPSGTAMPSGLTTGGSDIGVSRMIENWYMTKYEGRAKPVFQIYTASDGQYIQYDQNSTIFDFPIKLDLPAIEIKAQ